MRNIDDYFAGPVGRTLYHYSGVAALLGMAKSKSLWASNVYYLNDSSEITHACDALERVLERRFASGDLKSPEYEFLRQFKAWSRSFRDTMYNLFVFSLSEQASSLSQWRSYTPHGKGVSIGFTEQALNLVSELSNLRIAKCVYTKDEHEEIVRSLLEKLTVTFAREHSSIDTSQAHPSQCYHPFLERFRGDVLQVLSIIKNEAFEEEREWRLISPYYANYTVPAIKFREGACMLVPYIELPLGDRKPYFSSVILGPSQHQNLSMSALSIFLGNQGLCNATSNCVIPYREW